MKLLWGLLILNFSIQAQAGIETHGGDFLQCRCRSSMVLDYYQATLPTVAGPTELVNIHILDTQQTIDFFISRLEGLLVYPDIAKIMKEIGNYRKWVVVPELKDKSDEDLPYIPSGCEVQQAAIRQNGKVFVSQSALDVLSPSQLGVLVIHEVLAENFVNYQNDNPEISVSSDHARTVIAELLKVQPDYVNIARVFDMYGKSSSPFCSNVPLYLSFTSTSGVSDFETEGGATMDFVNRLFNAGDVFGTSAFYLRRGMLYARLNSSAVVRVVAASNVTCNARTNSCEGVAGGEYPGHRSFHSISRKYGKVKVELGSVAKLSFSNDSYKSVLRTGVKGRGEGPCRNLDKMLDQ